jgi:hypothetical protein
MTQVADQQWNAAATPPAALCWRCNYPLHGLGEPRCPECGRPFDPADPDSMNLGRPMGAFVRRLLRPAPWFEPVVYAYLLVMLGVGALFPLSRWSMIMAFFATWLLLGVPYFLRSAARHAVVKWYRQPRWRAQVDRAMTRRVGRTTAWAAALLFVQAPLYFSLLLSAPMLNRLGRERYEEMPFILANTVPLSRRWHGLFPVDGVYVLPSSATFNVWGGRFQLIYAPGQRLSWLDYVFRGQLTPSWSAG